MSKRALSDDFELRGLWWIPEDPERKIPGILSFDSEGINLELFGALREPRGSDRGWIREPSIILGIAEGKLVTVYGALATKLPAPRSDVEIRAIPPQLRSSIYNALHIFIGAHFESENEVRLTALDASFTHLEDWVGPERIPLEQENVETEEGETRTATYSLSKLIDVIVEEIESDISVGFDFTPTGSWFRSWGLEYDAFLSIFPNEQKDLKWYLSTLRDCQNLLTLFVGRPVHPRWVRAHVEGEYETFTSQGTMQGSVEMFSIEHSRPLRKQPHPPWYWRWDRVLVPLSSAEPNLGEMFNAWFDKADLLRPVYTLFFSTLYDPDMYLTSEFLSLAQALEVLHRRTSSDDHDKYFPKDEFEEYRQTMLSALPENVQDRLRGRIANLNEYSLKTRLDKLLGRIPHSVRLLVATEPEAFINRVRDTRDSLTHHTRKKKAFTDDEYFEGNARLRLWLVALLLLELGIDYEVIEEAAENFWRQYLPREDPSQS